MLHTCICFLQGLDQGVGHMFQTALLNFPLDFTTLVELSTALASATSDSASRVSKLQGQPQAVGHMFQITLLSFSLKFTFLVELSSAIALATSDSASSVSKLQGLDQGAGHMFQTVCSISPWTLPPW